MTNATPKLTQEQLETYAGLIYSNHYQHFLGYIHEHCLGDASERDELNECLEENGLDPLPDDFNYDIVVTDFDLKIQIGYRD